MTLLPESVTKAAAILRAGGLVAFPTETVYGLGADAANELAVRKIFQAKGRPYDHPLIVHIGEIAQMEDWAVDISPQAKKLAQTFWPGPLTIVLKKQARVLASVTGNQATVALRIPKHPIAQALLREFGGGIVAPSANKFTRLSPTTASAVHEELGDAIEMILDGGVCEVGLESTIIDMSNDQPVLLRPGKISCEALEKVLGKKVQTATVSNETRAPGMHPLHYAPTTKTTLIAPDHIFDFLQNLRQTDLPIGLVMYSHLDLMQKAIHPEVYYVKMSIDPTLYAHELYRTLRALDNQDYKRIVIESVPEEVEWDAIRDRLQKASGVREPK